MLFSSDHTIKKISIGIAVGGLCLQFILISSLIGITWFNDLTPIKFMYTYLHELGHLLTVLIMFGDVDSLQVYENFSGAVMFSDAHSFFPLVSGYIFPLVLGCILVTASMIGTSKQLVVVLLTLYCCCLLSMFFVKDGDNFTLHGIFWLSICIYIVGDLIPTMLRHVVVGFIGSCMAINSMITIYHSFNTQNVLVDAFSTSVIYGGTPQQWGTLWFITCVLCVIYTLVRILTYVYAYASRK